jgi:hypothetical protein
MRWHVAGAAGLRERTLAVVPALLSAALFALVAVVFGNHVRHMLAAPGVLDNNYCGLVDFRDQAYYPVVALLDGHNPYDAARYMREYPAVKVFAPYSPVMLWLFLPFGLLPLGLAQLLYYLLSLGLILLFARLTLRLCGWKATAAQVFCVATLILASRPGEWNTLLGQFAVLGAVATYVALYYGQTRPWLAGIGLTVSLFKPSYGVPVAILMLAQRDRRAVATGVTIAGALSLVVAVALVHAAGGIGPFLVVLRDGYAAWRAESGDPMHTAYRVDAAALVARLLGHSPGMAAELSISLGLMGLGAVVVRRLVMPPERQGARALAASLGSLVVLTAVYHLLYDLVLLVLPIAWTIAHLGQRLAGPRAAAAYPVILGLLVLPTVNYLASERAASVLGPSAWYAATALNGWAPLVALLIWMVLAFRPVGKEP